MKRKGGCAWEGCAYGIMARLSKEYIKSIIPDGMKKGEELLAEGRKIGAEIQAEYPKYYRKKGYKLLSEYNRMKAEKGEVNQFGINIGMATVDETAEACRALAEWGENVNVEPIGFTLPSMQVGVPKEKRDPELDTTAFMLNTQEDYDKFNMDEIYAPIGNFILVCPNAIETTVCALRAGLPSFGTSAQLAWDYPGCEDHVQVVEDIVRALGIIQSKKEMEPSTSSYVDDGLAGCCVDTVGYVGAYLLDRYIYTELCGVDCPPAFGGLVSDIKTRAALMKALSDLAQEVGLSLSFVHGSTTQQWDHDLTSNYGMSCQEALMTYLAEDHYKTGCTTLLAVPVTEAITVPTLEEIKEIIAAVARVGEFTDQWRSLINWDEIDEMAENLKREGRKMFENILTTLRDAGIDVTDPVPMLKFIKDIDSSLFEQAFHPSVWETGTYTAFYPNDMGKVTVAAIDKAMAQLKEKGYGPGTLKGMRIIAGSTDVHTYGLMFVNTVLSKLGADVVNAGVDNTAQTLLDAAAEEGIRYICASTHSGNAMGIANQFETLIKKDQLDCMVAMGGVLTSILPGHSEPSQIADRINEKDNMLATNNIVETVELFLRESLD